MNNAKQVVAYLEALARELAGGRTQYHILISGGAYMLLQRQRRSTEDIDFAQIAPPRRPKQNQVVGVAVQRGGEIATRASNTVFSQAVDAVAEAQGLPFDWLNDECASYLYTDAPGAEAYLWQSFEGVLFVYLPTVEYVFTLKIMANRRKDKPDIKVLAGQLGLRTTAEALTVIERFLAPEALQWWEIEKKLKTHFR
jgi:hypothetical protein